MADENGNESGEPTVEIKETAEKTPDQVCVENVKLALDQVNELFTEYATLHNSDENLPRQEELKSTLLMLADSLSGLGENIFRSFGYDVPEIEGE